ncbi:MAG TPA: SIR2 family protein [Anaerolineae bacterium]|nr:SIR2 family protein [Anaerolineae bacterium]
MTSIPSDLLEQFQRGSVALFIGDRIMRDVEGSPFIDRLAAELAERCGVADTGLLDFAKLAQIYADQAGRQALQSFVLERIEQRGSTSQPLHQAIARLIEQHGAEVIVTTCWDNGLERTLRARGYPIDVIIGNVDVVFESKDKARLYKLRGSQENVESLVLTEDDYALYFENQSSISIVLQGYLASRTLLFIGYDFSDPYFRQLYHKVTASLDRYARRAYALDDGFQPYIHSWCRQHGVEVLRIDPTAFLAALIEQLPAQLSQPPAPLVPLSSLDEPYKLLDFFTPEDAPIFFGREQEIEKFSALLHARRLVVLYGNSGVGKTSLLLAGVKPHVEASSTPYEMFYVRMLDDPTLAIRRAISQHPAMVHLPEEGPLIDFLDAAAITLGRPLVIVLDQFEEFFIRQSATSRAAFMAELAAWHEARRVPVKVILSLREDWLAALSELETYLPEVLSVNHRLRLLPLTRDQARHAIILPVARLNITYEASLLDQLLDDLTEGNQVAVMPPPLQLVCSALYSALPPGERVITLAMYTEIGGTRGVLRRYLDESLKMFERDERVLAQAVLQELITSQGTKDVKTHAELGVALQVPPQTLQVVVNRLVRLRLLRPVILSTGDTAYELTHEYLIHELEQGAEFKQRKQIEELIAQEVNDWQRFGTLMAADKLKLVNGARSWLRLAASAQELLLRSAIQSDIAPDYWLNQVQDPAHRAEIAADCLRHPSAEVRARTAQALRAWNAPEASKLLVETALHDTTALVRQRAADSLQVQRHAVLEGLLLVTQGEDRTARRQALDDLAWWRLYVGPMDLQRSLQWPVYRRVARLKREAAYRETERQTRIGRWAAVIGAVPLVTYVAVHAVEKQSMPSALVPFVVVWLLIAALSWLGGLMFSYGFGSMRAMVTGWPLARRIITLGASSAILGLIAFLPLTLDRWGWIAGLILGLAVPMAERPARAFSSRITLVIAIGIGALAGLGAGWLGPQLVGMLTADDGLAIIACSCFGASLTWAALTPQPSKGQP